jgi:hypothetical protein
VNKEIESRDIIKVLNLDEVIDYKGIYKGSECLVFHPDEILPVLAYLLIFY